MRTIIVRHEEEFKFSCTEGLFNSFDAIADFLNSVQIGELNYVGNDLLFQSRGVSIKLVNYKKVLEDETLFELNKNIIKHNRKKKKGWSFSNRLKTAAATLFLSGLLSFLPSFSPENEICSNEQNVYMDEENILTSVNIDEKDVFTGYSFLESKFVSRGGYVRETPIVVPEPKTVVLSSETKTKYDVIKEKYPIFLMITDSFNIEFNAAIDYLILKEVDYGDVSSVLHNLYEYSIDNGEFFKEELSQMEIEEKIIKYALVLGADDPEYLATIIAVFRYETGYGTSNIANNYNNYGGHLVNGEPLSYNNGEIGAYRQVAIFNYNYRLAVDRGYNTNLSIEENIVHSYCPDGSPWALNIFLLKEKVHEDYSELFKGKVLKYVENNYTSDN